MPFGLDDIALGSTILSGLGGLFGGGQQPNETQAQFEERIRQFNEQMALQRQSQGEQSALAQTKGIGDINRQLEMAPLRDKVSYMLSARLGQVPQNFQARDMFNPSSAPTQGGIDPAKLQSAANTYRAPTDATPGSGGVDLRVYNTLMQRLGLGKSPTGIGIGEVPLYGAYAGGQTGQAPGTPAPPAPPTPGGMPGGSGLPLATPQGYKNAPGLSSGAPASWMAPDSPYQQRLKAQGRI